MAIDESSRHSSLLEAMRRGQRPTSRGPEDLDQPKPGSDDSGLPALQPSMVKRPLGRRRVRKPRRALVLFTFSLALAGVALLPNGPLAGVMRQANTAAVDLASSNHVVYDLLGLLGLARVRAALGLPPICERFHPTFLYGFADLKVRIGDKMGRPLECERAIHPSGDTQQRTTTGLAYYRKGVNIPTFTNGSDHWALTHNGLVYWIGDVVDPPGMSAATASGR
jgi:hypothetical protein